MCLFVIRFKLSVDVTTIQYTICFNTVLKSFDTHTESRLLFSAIKN